MSEGESDQLKALRLPESDVYHYTRDGREPICGMADGDKFNEERAQVADVESAEQFFRLCTTCEQTYHPEFGMTTAEIRQEIRAELGAKGNSGNFNVRELMAIHGIVVQDGEWSLHTGGDRDV